MPRTPPAVVAAPRRKPGRGSQVTPVERREIQRLHLADGMGQRQIATHTGRTRETVAAQLQGEDYERIRGELETDLIETVQRQLKNNAGRAATAWITALDRAAQKGNHKPAKDLLLHTGVIEPLGGETAGAHVAIVIGTVPAPTDEELEAAQAREEARRTGGIWGVEGGLISSIASRGFLGHQPASGGLANRCHRRILGHPDSRGLVGCGHFRMAPHLRSSTHDARRDLLAR